MRLSGKREYDLLKRLSYTRLAGSEEEKKAAGILADTIREIGFTPEVEEFEIEDAQEPIATLEVTAPYHKTYQITGYKCCKSTDKDGWSGRLLYVDSALDADLVGAKDAFVLISTNYVNLETYRRLLKAGVAGFITIDGDYFDKPGSSDLNTRKLRTHMTVHGLLSAAHIRVKDAMEMVSKHATDIHINIQNTNETYTSQNVYTVVEGTDHPDEIISLGAHYDSVNFSKGVYDNASGSVILMEMLRYFKENPPKRTLRFQWYGSEELGLLGSKHYVKTHEEDLEKHIFMINVDMAGTFLGKEYAIVTAEDCLRIYTDYFMKMNGYGVEVKQDTYSSDNMPFSDKKIPSISFARFAASGAGYYHHRNDTMMFMSADSLLKTTKYVLDFTQTMANAAVFPVPRTMPENMVEKIDKYFFKKEFEEAEEKEAKNKEEKDKSNKGKE